MTGPVHEVKTTYVPHRNLIASVTNRANGGTGILPVHRDGPPGPQPADPSLTDVVNQAKPGGARSPLPAAQPTIQDAVGTVARSATDGSIVSSYVYANDLLGRHETISQGGEAFAMLKLGESQVEVAYNERSEVVGASYRSGKETQQKFEYDYDGIGNRKRSASEIGGQKSEASYETNALNQYTAILKTPTKSEYSQQSTKNEERRTKNEERRTKNEERRTRHFIRSRRKFDRGSQESLHLGCREPPHTCRGQRRQTPARLYLRLPKPPHHEIIIIQVSCEPLIQFQDEGAQGRMETTGCGMRPPGQVTSKRSEREFLD